MDAIYAEDPGCDGELCWKALSLQALCYEVEKRTFSAGQRLDRDQVLLKFFTRFDNLLRHRQRMKGGGRKGAGHAFDANARGSGKFGGKRHTPRGA
ncbi:unnamed protein product, partial [Ascophyllum nodosum]